MDYGTGGVYT